MMWVLIRSASNEYHMFLWRNKKYIYFDTHSLSEAPMPVHHQCVKKESKGDNLCSKIWSCQYWKYFVSKLRIQF